MPAAEGNRSVYSTDSEASLVFTGGCEADASFTAIPGVGECVKIDDCAFHKCGPFGECRDLFRPAEGYTLVGADLSGLELRCLAHFLKDNGTYAKVSMHFYIDINNGSF